MKLYVQQSSNNKHIEKSFARRESQRELMKFKQDLKLISSERCRFTWAKDKEKVIVVMNSVFSKLKVTQLGILTVHRNNDCIIFMIPACNGHGRPN